MRSFSMLLLLCATQPAFAANTEQEDLKRPPGKQFGKADKGAADLDQTPPNQNAAPAAGAPASSAAVSTSSQLSEDYEGAMRKDESYLTAPRQYVSNVLGGYKKHALVNVFVNKVWPSGSPSETYRYYDQPLACAPDLVYPQLMSLGQILKGDRLVSSKFDFSPLPDKYKSLTALPDSDPMKQDKEFIFETNDRAICTRYLDPDQVEALKKMIDRYFVCEVQVDDGFPVTGFIGMKLEKETAQIYEDMEREAEKNGAEGENQLRYSAERMWGEYHSELFNPVGAENTSPENASPGGEEKTGGGAFTGRPPPPPAVESREAKAKEPEYRYFLITTYDFQITHTFGEIRQVKFAQPGLRQMLEITKMPADGAYLAAHWSSKVSWYANVAEYPESREEAIDTQIEENDYHLYHDLDPDLDNERKNMNWDWLHLPDGPKYQMRVHWLGIFNGPTINGIFVMVVVLVSVVAYLTRNVREDLREFGLPVGGGLSGYEVAGEERSTGWKLIHADVFRPPKHRLWLCASLGAGTQLLVMSFCTILTGCAEHFHKRGAVLATMAYAYIFASLVGGYVSGSWYQRLHGEAWTLNMFATCVIFAGPAFGVWSITNSIAICYNSTAAFPFAYILLLWFLYVCVTVPLTLIGCAFGKQIALRDLRNSEAGSYFPCRTNKLERMIPGEGPGGPGSGTSSGLSRTTGSRTDSSNQQGATTASSGGFLSTLFLTSAYPQYFICGVFPFISIYVELHYIFDSMWGPARYTVYGILLLSAVLTLANASLVTCFFLYVQLARENWKWWWRVFISGGSVSAFFLLYCGYFYTQTHMDSFLQLSFFVLYSLVIAYGLSLLMGALTFLTCASFMRFLYSHIKGD